MIYLVYIAGFLLFAFTISQLVDLLRRRDEEFPNRSDRLIWCMVILLVPGIGAILFAVMKPFRPAESPDTLADELDKLANPRGKA